MLQGLWSAPCQISSAVRMTRQVPSQVTRVPSAPFASMRLNVMLLATADAPMRTAENPATQPRRGCAGSHARRCTHKQHSLLPAVGASTAPEKCL